MLYLGIHQNKRQLTVNLRNEDGFVILKRQVSTRWEEVRTFFADLAEKAKSDDGFMAILPIEIGWFSVREPCLISPHAFRGLHDDRPSKSFGPFGSAAA